MFVHIHCSHIIRTQNKWTKAAQYQATTPNPFFCAETIPTLENTLFCTSHTSQVIFLQTSINSLSLKHDCNNRITDIITLRYPHGNLNFLWTHQNRQFQHEQQSDEQSAKDFVIAAERAGLCRTNEQLVSDTLGTPLSDSDQCPFEKFLILLQIIHVSWLDHGLHSTYLAMEQFLDRHLLPKNLEPILQALTPNWSFAELLGAQTQFVFLFYPEHVHGALIAGKSLRRWSGWTAYTVTAA